MQPGLCTRHCHIEQTSFFLHILVQHRAAMRRDALIGIENIDNGKFQPLGTVHRRERDRIRLRPPLRRLPERERQVIALRFYHGLTQQRAAELLHISQVQVSRLERRAVERMRVWLDA